MQVQRRNVGGDEFAFVTIGHSTALVYPFKGQYGVFQFSKRSQRYTRLVDQSPKLEIAIKRAAEWLSRRAS